MAEHFFMVNDNLEGVTKLMSLINDRTTRDYNFVKYSFATPSSRLGKWILVLAIDLD
jgi:hypothetical protein